MRRANPQDQTPLFQPLLIREILLGSRGKEVSRSDLSHFTKQRYRLAVIVTKGLTSLVIGKSTSSSLSKLETGAINRGSNRGAEAVQYGRLLLRLLLQRLPY